MYLFINRRENKLNRDRGVDRISAVIQERAMLDHDKIYVAIKPTTLGSYK